MTDEIHRKAEPDWRDLRDAGIPEKYWTASPDAIRTKLGEERPEWFIKAEHYINNIGDAVRRGINLCLTGPWASGKTALGCVILREAMRGMPVGAMNPSQFFQACDLVKVCIENPFCRETPFRSIRWVERLRSVNLLLLDDMSFDPHEAKWLNQLVRTRIGRGKTTIITGNITSKAMELNGLTGLLSVIDRWFTVLALDSRWVEEAHREHDDFFGGGTRMQDEPPAREAEA